MRTKKISRREFLTDLTAAAGAVALVACVPATPSTVENQIDEPLDIETTPQPSVPGRELKVLIVYDSVYGNTAKIAASILEGIGAADTPAIVKAQEATLVALEDIDLLIVGSPTHGGTFTEPVKNYLNAITTTLVQDVKAAVFDTSFSKETEGVFMDIIIDVFGYAAPKLAGELGAKGALVVASESFFVLDTEGPLKEGEIERSSEWGRELVTKLVKE